MSDLYYVKIIYNNISFNALIDSGAQISIISPLMLQKLNIKTNLSTIGHVHGIGGKDKIMGNINCKINLVGNKLLLPVQVKFTIVLNYSSIILGLDFLEKYQCLINCHHKMLHLQQYKIPIYSKQNKLLTITDKQPIKNKQHKKVII